MKKAKLILVDGTYEYQLEGKKVGFVHSSLEHLYSPDECGEYTQEQLAELAEKHGTPLSLPNEHSGYLTLARSNDMGLFHTYMSMEEKEYKKEQLHTNGGRL